MPTSLKQLKDQALALSIEERAYLAKCLLKSLHSPPPDPATQWVEKVRQRFAATAGGDDSAFPDKDMFDEVRRLTREAGEMQRTGERQFLEQLGCMKR